MLSGKDVKDSLSTSVTLCWKLTGRELLYSLNNDKPYEEHETTGFLSPTGKDHFHHAIVPLICTCLIVISLRCKA